MFLTWMNFVSLENTMAQHGVNLLVESSVGQSVHKRVESRIEQDHYRADSKSDVTVRWTDMMQEKNGRVRDPTDSKTGTDNCHRQSDPPSYFHDTLYKESLTE